MQAHILIVEDEPAIRDLIAYALRTQSYQPICAQDAKEAFLAVSERIPVLI